MQRGRSIFDVNSNFEAFTFPFFFQTWNCSSLISGSQKTRHVFFWMFKPFKDFEASDFELLKQRMRLIQRII